MPTDTPQTPHERTAQVSGSLSNDLARGRTHLANERTHLAYLRTKRDRMGHTLPHLVLGEGS